MAMEYCNSLENIESLNFPSDELLDWVHIDVQYCLQDPIPYNCSTMASSPPLVSLVVLYTVVQYTVLGFPGIIPVGKAGHPSHLPGLLPNCRV